MLSTVREGAGMHDYDGRVQDLSPGGVSGGLAQLDEARRRGPAEPDALDEAQLSAFEATLIVRFRELEEHRRNPYPHLDNLDLAPYDREYAPAEVRDQARRQHLAAWPDAVDAAVESLDAVSASVAEALLPAVRGLAAPLGAGGALEGLPEAAAAGAAHARLVAHVERAAADGDPDPALGPGLLARLLGVSEATTVDLGRLEEDADAERTRLRALLVEACDRVSPGAPVPDTIAGLLGDHPDASAVLDEARAQAEETIAFSRDHELAPHLDGQCLVGPAPPSRRWAMAMMSWAGPFEDDAPSWYHVTPPEPDWPTEQQEEWLQVFSRSTLPAITVHEVAPGHFAHGRALRRASGDVRRALHSLGFAEGWAHYAEELCLEEGFRDGDPRFMVGVALEALTRVTRLASSIGIHSRSLTLDEAAARFTEDAFLQGPAARSEAVRATFDPTYGRYTWGKLAILALRDEARARWGRRYSHARFHRSLLELGSPCLGLMGAILGDPA